MIANVKVNNKVGLFVPSPLKKGDKARAIAFQKECRDRYNDEGIPPVDLSLKKAIVRRISFQEAKQIILKYEWLGRMSATKYQYGIFFDPINEDFGGVCGGVVCIGGQNCTGASYTHRMLKINEPEVGILARGACVHWAPEHTNSKLVAAACRMVAKESSYKVILAYADPAAGEIGTIYQACNWIAIGKTVAQFRMYNKEGKSFDSAKIIVEAQKRGIRWSEMYAIYQEHGWHKVKGNSKYRYAFIIDKKHKELKEAINNLRTDYPKRDSIL